MTINTNRRLNFSKTFDRFVTMLKSFQQVEKFTSLSNLNIPISCSLFSDGMKRLAIARELETWCAKEMYDIEICSQCFSRTMDSNDWFTDICDPPHLLVWAKLAGYPYWPAKLIGILSTANRLDVRFFGDHDMANVSAQDCFLYPSKNPNRRLDEKTEQQIEASEKVTTNLKRIFSID